MSGQLAFSHDKKRKPQDLVWGLIKLDRVSIFRMAPKKTWYRVKL